MKITIIVIKLLFLGALLIISNHNLYLTESTDFAVFSELYTGWIGHLFQQGFEVTAYVVKFEWLPEIDGDYVSK